MKAPKAKQLGFAYSELEPSNISPCIKFAGLTLTNCQIPIQIRNIPLLQVEQSEIRSGPFRLSATFFDANGNPSLFIRQNEWSMFSNSWDVETSGGIITIRNTPREIALRLKIDPGKGVIIERINMFCAGFYLDGDTENLNIITPSGSKNCLTECIVDNCKIGLKIN
jgi:hypothetical protein